jgi:general secretion pathway protein G
MNTNQLRRRAAGHVVRRYFSLMEIMIVVVIIGMIASIIGPNLMRNLGKAQQNKARAQITILKNAVKDYYLDMSEYPPKLEDLVTDPGSEKWDGPYLDPAKIPLDPWGEDYHYENPGQHGDFDIYSYGADKAPGGKSKNADINSWE